MVKYFCSDKKIETKTFQSSPPIWVPLTDFGKLLEAPPLQKCLKVLNAVEMSRSLYWTSLICCLQVCMFWVTREDYKDNFLQILLSPEEIKKEIKIHSISVFNVLGMKIGRTLI